MQQKSITILGATGSVGCSTKKVIDAAKASGDAQFDIVAITANENVADLAAQAIDYGAAFAAVAEESKYNDLKDALAGTDIKCGAGASAINEAAAMQSDMVMAAIVGAAGLQPVLTAGSRGADIAFANKECLVCAGDLVMETVRNAGGRMLPVDSEHNAIFQVYDFDQPEKISKIILTASGGPFRAWPLAQMKDVTPAQAVAHPNWSMGAKISVDSATMMNKGLELIEACYLFPTPEPQIEILVHPQSVIHSMVEYVDGSTLAQLGPPDMVVPIASALSWPNRIHSGAGQLDFTKTSQLTFDQPDAQRFPALRLARQAYRAGSRATTVLNAANEILVARFLAEEIGFLDIVNSCEDILTKLNPQGATSGLYEIYELDAQARGLASE